MGVALSIAALIQRRHWPTRAVYLVCALAIADGTGCRQPSADAPEAVPVGETPLTEEQRAWLAELARMADANPGDFATRKASGLAHMQMALSGAIDLRERAEADLEAAFELDPNDRELTRSLGRFYNMRAVEGDDSKAQWQVKVYGAHLGNLAPDDMNTSEFVSWSFFQLGRILTFRNKGQLLKALSAIRELEATLAERTKREPDNIELHALAGNFAFFFAGNVPFDKKRRVEVAVGYFEHVRAHWDEMRAGAKDPLHCPNTRENFMFELAEGYLVLEKLEKAKAIHTELSQIRGRRTRAKEQIAFVSAERTRNAAAYAGALELMPPWPSDVGNCVVCHSWSAPVPMNSLYSLAPISLDEIPSEAFAKPIGDLRMGIRPAESSGHSAAAAPVEATTALAPRVAALFEESCAPCHFGSGEASHLLRLDDPDATRGARESIVERTQRGEMPPDEPLSLEAVKLLQDWRSELESDGE